MPINVMLKRLIIAAFSVPFPMTKTMTITTTMTLTMATTTAMALAIATAMQPAFADTDTTAELSAMFEQDQNDRKAVENFTKPGDWKTPGIPA